MKRLLMLGILVLGVTTFAFASGSAPEIDAGQAMSALALLSGSVLVIRARRKT